MERGAQDVKENGFFKAHIPGDGQQHFLRVPHQQVLRIAAVGHGRDARRPQETVDADAGSPLEAVVAFAAVSRRPHGHAVADHARCHAGPELIHGSDRFMPKDRGWGDNSLVHVGVYVGPANTNVFDLHDRFPRTRGKHRPVFQDHISDAFV